jgi:hypothetical protein
MDVATFWDIAPFAARWFRAWPIFYPEDGSDTFLRNVDSHADYTELHPRRWPHF